MSRSGLDTLRLLTTLGTWGWLDAGARVRLRSAANLVAILCYEYRRAVAAGRRYEELRRTDGLSQTRTGIANADITRRVFVEMYADYCPSSDRS
jgi:hypothetical protein